MITIRKYRNKNNKKSNNKNNNNNNNYDNRYAINNYIGTAAREKARILTAMKKENITSWIKTHLLPNAEWAINKKKTWTQQDKSTSKQR